MEEQSNEESDDIDEIVTRRKQKDIRINKQKKEKEKIKKAQMRKYVELEADLGSDDEEHDGVVKSINSEDIEEDEEGQDEDLKDFVV